ncbi:hypothetical protein OLX02_13540 [Novosphingobium sp. KCTC 2891]|uniref:hypothetical protein n=1 Tax=Novosphingobium sp. KCTC 2891 TaxID=2989730 RepID=UPI002222B843|nr:hypothetical protein [Novosphingobium sp. KCTC 2891]MCW1383844.1 hypothetical protein [Novosphingobium sp. KCTC 2891]
MTAQESDRILAEARQSLVRQREGGRRVGGRSIGQRSAEVKRRHLARKAARMAMAVAVVLLGAMVAGLVIDGIGFTGLVVTFLAIVGALWFFGTFPRLKVPDLASLNSGDVRTMVGRTELWLEAQRPALPAPAVGLVDQIGVQLDGLGVQLEGLDPAEPAVAEVRRLVGEHLPGMVESYRRIPAALRKEQRGGRDADQQLADGLGKISQEINEISRQLAAGDIDALAVRGRYLDYKYGDGLEETRQLAAPPKDT